MCPCNCMQAAQEILSVPANNCSVVLSMQGCFDSAIERYEYGGAYRGVFPVKCNHDRELLAAVLHAGKPFGFGLEARDQWDIWYLWQRWWRPLRTTKDITLPKAALR